jgi:hypothetical protein
VNGAVHFRPLTPSLRAQGQLYIYSTLLELYKGHIFEIFGTVSLYQAGGNLVNVRYVFEGQYETDSKDLNCSCFFKHYFRPLELRYLSHIQGSKYPM